MPNEVKRIVLLSLCAGVILAGWILVLSLLHRPPRINLTETSPVRELTLDSGKAVVLVMPNNRELAVWNKKPGRLERMLFSEGASMGYGEKPFQQLSKFEQIQLPGGGTTSGESLSYIRPGGVMHGGNGRPSEYILFIDEFKISLKQVQLQPSLQLRVKMEKASVEEKIRPRDQIDHDLALLQSQDSIIRAKGVDSLSRLLIVGSTFAELRETEIVNALQNMARDPDPSVRHLAAEKLCEAGDPDSILTALESMVNSATTDAKTAHSLGRWMRYPTKSGSTKPVYDRAIQLAESTQESAKIVGVAFLSGCPTYKPAAPAIRRALSDTSASVRAAAVQGLEQVFGNNHFSAREQSVSMLKDTSPEVIIAVLESSIYVGEGRMLPFPVIEPFLNHENRKLRIAAIQALRLGKGSEKEKRLLPITHEDDPKIRAEAAQALAGGIMPDTIQRFVELLDDSDVTVRIRAIQGLGSQRPDAVSKRLDKETDPDVIRVAKKALKEDR